MPKKLVYLSPSSLQRWFDLGCPAAWDYDKQFSLTPAGERFLLKQGVDLDTSWADRGTLVHSMLAGEMPLESVTDNQAKMFYEKLDQLRQGLMLKAILGSEELNQAFEILPGVQWVRRLDLLAEGFSKELLVNDYKTTGAVWKVMPAKKINFSPQANGFQGIGYLIPPPEGSKAWQATVELLGGKFRWPKKALFLVAGFRGPAQVFTYKYDKADEENLFEAIRLVESAVRSESFPKVRSKKCLECPFQMVCNNVPNHKRFYKPKTHSRKTKNK